MSDFSIHPSWLDSDRAIARSFTPEERARLAESLRLMRFPKPTCATIPEAFGKRGAAIERMALQIVDILETSNDAFEIEHALKLADSIVSVRFSDRQDARSAAERVQESSTDDQASAPPAEHPSEDH